MLAALAAGCAGPSSSPKPDDGGLQVEAETSDTLEGAAVFECESGETIQARFNYDPASATLVRQSGDVIELPLVVQEAAEFETYAAESISLAVGPGEARFMVGDETTACQGVSRPIGPPAIDGVVRALRQSDDGATIELEIGETFSIALVGVPTAGYQWAPAGLPNLLEEADSTGGATSTAQYLPGFAGGNHWEVMAFRALTEGRADLVIEERRPFEDASEPAADTFRVSIVVR